MGTVAVSIEPLPTPPRLLVVSAPSGTGKTTLCARLMARHGDLRLSISSTTRAIRSGETDGVDYDFLPMEDFRAMVAADQFVEWAEVHGRCYGTTRRRVSELVDGGFQVLFDVDVQGAESLKKVYGDEAVTVMVLPPSLEELERRLRGRGTDDEDVIRVRLSNALGELARWRTFDFVVVNDDLDQATLDLEAILGGNAYDLGRARAVGERLSALHGELR